MKRPQRLLAILVALQANRQMTAAELAEQFAVSKRTILRDIGALADADVPIVAERGRYGGIALLPGADVDVSRLTGNEAEALALIGVDLARARQLGVEAATRSAAQKLASRRPWPTSNGDAEHLSLSEVVAIDNSAWFTPEESTEVAALARDIRLGKRLRVEYRASGRQAPRERTVDPYGLFSRGGRWYLIADVEGEPRMFAMSRLHSWTVLDDDRRTRSDVTLSNVAHDLVSGLEDRQTIVVTACLDAHTEDIARRILGSRLLSVDPTSNPRKVSITVGYDQLNGVRQLMQFTDHVEVTDPPEARQLIAALADQIAKRHQHDDRA